MEVYVIGAGAAGLMAAVSAADAGAAVTLLETMEKPGRKDQHHRKRPLQSHKPGHPGRKFLFF